MTYNVGNGLAHPGPLADLLRRAAVDIVALQELAAPQAEVLASELADIYPYQVLVPTGFPGKGLLSRYPVIGQEQLALYPERPDLHVTVDIEKNPLNLLVAHPPPPRVMGARLVFDPRAEFQLDALANLVLEHAPGVLLGDFNMTRRNAVYARFVAAGLEDAFAVAGSGRGWTLPMRLGHSARLKHGLQRMRLRPVARVDYIWCTPGLHAQAAWVGEDAGSDHLPVVARLELQRA